MVGVFPIIVWTKPTETGDGYIARAEARTIDGALVGAAEAECSRAEFKWKNRDPFALRSMASTRAISRALRGPLEQVVVLAGYEATAAEEMPTEPAPAAEPARGKIPAEHRPTREQNVRIGELMVKLSKQDPDTDWRVKTRELAGVPGDMLTKTLADRLIRELETNLHGE
jgi:hypothetical protein